MHNRIMPDYTENHSWGVLQSPLMLPAYALAAGLYTDEETSQYSSGSPSCIDNSAGGLSESAGLHSWWGLRFVAETVVSWISVCCVSRQDTWKGIWWNASLLLIICHIPPALCRIFTFMTFSFPSKISSHRQKSASVMFPLHFPCTGFRVCL